MAKVKEPLPQWKNRIVGSAIKPASSFLANPLNWRIHPFNQQAALKGALDSVGWIQEVIVNLRLSSEWGTSQGVETLIDGHLRVSLALREGDDTPIPVKLVDLNPSEENIALATIDPIGALAMADREKLSELLHETKPQDAALQQMLSEMAAREGLVPPDVEFKEYDESVADEVKYLECPQCHHRWPQ